MATYKVSELEGALLDAAVAKAEGWSKDEADPGGWWSPDKRIASSITNKGIISGYGFHPAHFWNDGGPIIERERIGVMTPFVHNPAYVGPPGPAIWWEAEVNYDYVQATASNKTARADGPTPLIAAMRAYVGSRFGETIELP